MPDPYATPAQLADWLPDGQTVAEPERLLRRASDVVDEAVTGTFTVDDDGLPTDSDTAAVLRDAACAQVEHWLEVGEANDIDGLAGSQVSVTGYSGRRPPRYGPRMLSILRRNGLINPGNDTTAAQRFFHLEAG